VERFERRHHTRIGAGGLQKSPPVDRKVERLGARELGVRGLAEAPLEELPDAVSHIALDPRLGKFGTLTSFEELVHRSGDVLPRIHESSVQIENDELHAAFPIKPARAL